MLSALLEQDNVQQMFTDAINKALLLDPEITEKLRAFSGKVIGIHVKDIDKKLYLLINDSSIDIVFQYEDKIDTQITGSVISLSKMFLKRNVATLLLKGEVEISGDTRLGSAFKKLFSEMEINWQQPVAATIGDGATQLLENKLAKIKQWGSKSFQSFGFSLSEYIQEESRDVVTETELEIFHQDVDTFRDSTDRLEAKLKALILNRQSKKNTKE